ncbi:MAG: restriction endonuclease [Cyanobacteria bacterium J06639_18]
MAGITNYTDGEGAQVISREWVVDEEGLMYYLRLLNSPRNGVYDYGSDIGIDPRIEPGDKVVYRKMSDYCGVWLAERHDTTLDRETSLQLIVENRKLMDKYSPYCSESRASSNQKGPDSWMIELHKHSNNVPVIITDQPLKSTTNIVSISLFDQNKYSHILDDPKKLQRLNDEEFEEFIADRFSAMGFTVKQVGQTRRKDGGVDLVAWPKKITPFPFLIAVQVKHHHTSRKTGVGDVRDFNGVITASNSQFHLGVLVTNTSFTADAKWFADNNSRLIRLRDMCDLCRWIQNDFVADLDWREIPKEIELAPNIKLELPELYHRENRFDNLD